MLPLFILWYTVVLAWEASQLLTSGAKERKIILFSPEVSQERGYQIVRSHGGRVVKELPLINGVVAEFPPEREALAALARHPQVQALEEDGIAETCGLPCPASLTREDIPWGVERIGAPAAWERTMGDGVKVAVLDTGVDSSHPDLRGNLKRRVNLKFPGYPAGDGNGHGTHVAGIIAAAYNNLGVIGVAPRAEIYAVKILDRWGKGYISDIVTGLEWAVKNKVHIANMSLGTSSQSLALKKAVEVALKAGILLVASAGNGGKNGEVLYPARYPGVIAVTATTKQDTLADFSSRGPEVTVAAPGENILSTYPGGRYQVMSGTSMAAPHVSGVLALILAANPSLKATEARRILEETAHKLPGLTPYEQGSGLVYAGWLGVSSDGG
ncbi:subtilisin [Thermanaeromonas toyohensis ToBE]|uniref:Subtilisin n=1 Tax=Thermanaeromonas toyohensis ToBE TaxID=698762 RepID=A0A1W1W2D9_9FIRM|nr:S8 family peptidase [Thermanaeromonas toyohensis]SMB99785.1 subtilisin [Thermanaeromonas toyohensis ToBE]